MDEMPNTLLEPGVNNSLRDVFSGELSVSVTKSMQFVTLFQNMVCLLVFNELKVLIENAGEGKKKYTSGTVSRGKIWKLSVWEACLTLFRF